jgi:hypothetical protein
MEYKVQKPNLFTALFWAIMMLIALFAMSHCSFKPIVKDGFAFLGKLTEQKIKELLKYEGTLSKDSVHIAVTLPRTHCRKVLGKKLNAWVTYKGQASINKTNEFIALSWEVLPDTSKVKVTFQKMRK